MIPTLSAGPEPHPVVSSTLPGRVTPPRPWAALPGLDIGLDQAEFGEGFCGTWFGAEAPQYLQRH